MVFGHVSVSLGYVGHGSVTTYAALGRFWTQNVALHTIANAARLRAKLLPRK